MFFDRNDVPIYQKDLQQNSDNKWSLEQTLISMEKQNRGNAGLAFSYFELNAHFRKAWKDEDFFILNSSK